MRFTPYSTSDSRHPPSVSEGIQTEDGQVVRIVGERGVINVLQENVMKMPSTWLSALSQFPFNISQSHELKASTGTPRPAGPF